MPAQAEQVSAEPEQIIDEKEDDGGQNEGAVAVPSSSEPEDGEKKEGMSAIEKIKAAQAARLNRRARQRPLQAAAPESNPTGEEESSDDPAVAAVKKSYEKKLDSLRKESSSLRLEMGSLRRNHLQNIKKITEERDMFALQLANEQTASGNPSSDNRKVEDMNVQLRSARNRNNDLEEENASLRDEIKQLKFRVHANKTLDAASDGYEKIVEDLVNVKLKCAQLQEEKEDLLRINKELMGTSSVLRDANGQLEKSRSEWVVRCAELEKQKQELEDKIRGNQVTGTSTDPSDSGSLHDIKLN